MSQHLTRKEMKRDEVAELVERSVDYVGGHRRSLFIGLGVAGGVIVLALAGVWWMSTRADRANELLARGLKLASAPVGVTSPKPDDPKEPSFADEAARRAATKALFEDLSRRPFADAADVADVYLGRIAMDEGDAARARELWQDFADSHSDHVLAGGVRRNLIALDRQQGKAAEVATQLEAMLAATGEHRPLPGDVVLVELARTYEQLGRGMDAISTYRRLAEEYPQSPYAGEARSKAGPDVPRRVS